MENKLLDATNEKILSILTANARASYSAIAQEVGLSAPAVKERMRRLEDAGIITGYRAEVNQQRLGKPIGAFILVAVPYSQEKAFVRFVNQTEAIESCHHLLGDRAFILQVRLGGMEALETLLSACMRFGQTTTHMLLSKVK